MYWSNPLIECVWPGHQDPVPQLLAHGHCLLWHPEFRFREANLVTNQRLQDLCDWANRGIGQGVHQFVADPKNHYDIANLVKLNMWAHDIQRQGIVKPWLILDWGDRLEAGTGDSRLRLCEIMPGIQHTPAFVSTRLERRHLYPDHIPVVSLDQMAHIVSAVPGQRFLFRPTDAQAPFGIYWYEYDSDRTRSVTPGESWSVQAFSQYAHGRDVVIEPDWFLDPIDWWSMMERSSN